MTPFRKQLFLVIALVIVAVESFSLASKEVKHQELIAELHVRDEAPFRLGERTKETGCQVRGPLPDPDCTPGSIFPDATAEITCVSGYTKTVRNVSTKLKKQVYASYGVPYPQPRGTYEADHLIPLALGGDNDIANLFPESGNTTPGFREKDIVENYLRGEVCDGRVSLKSAQMQIAENWVAVYDKLTPSDITRIKNMFKNSYGAP